MFTHYREVLAYTSICLDLPFEVGEVGVVCSSSPPIKCGLIPYQTVETEWTNNPCLHVSLVVQLCWSGPRLFVGAVKVVV